MNRIVTLFYLLALSGSQATAESWITDFNAAQEQAQQTGKPMLVYVFDGR